MLPLPILTCPATNPQKWKFLTLKHWAADPRGTWRLSLKDTAGNGLGGRLSSWELILHGAATNPRVDPGCSAVAQSGSRGVVEGVGRDQSRPTCTNPPMAGGSRLCAPGCIAAYLGNGVCDAPCNNDDCDYDFGDCHGGTETNVTSCAPGCPISWISDHYCDETCQVCVTRRDSILLSTRLPKRPSITLCSIHTSVSFFIVLVVILPSITVGTESTSS